MLAAAGAAAGRGSLAGEFCARSKACGTAPYCQQAASRNDPPCNNFISLCLALTVDRQVPARPDGCTVMDTDFTGSDKQARALDK